MPPYGFWLSEFGCSTFQELYSDLELIAWDEMGLDSLPFTLSDLEHPPGNNQCPDINDFIEQCSNQADGNNSHADAINLIKFLKVNPPGKSFENPKLPDSKPTEDEANLINHILVHGIDLPGSKQNLFGHLQYFSSFFIDIFFGNYTEFMDHITALSNEELEKELQQREGYCQYSPIFAPILGLKLVDLENSFDFTSIEKQKIRTMYSGFNENQHFDILMELLDLGVDVNAHDINGYTPLHYSTQSQDHDMVTVLLENGANPNSESRNGYRPLTMCTQCDEDFEFKVIDILLFHDSKLSDMDDINNIRSNVETCGSKELALKVRQAPPREKEDCEKCSDPAVKKCSACKMVYYCTPACQKLDWKFHKVTCQKN